MKKIILFVLLFVVSFSLVSCDIYADRTKKDMELIEVKVYDKDGVELTGELKDYFGYTWENERITETAKTTPLNSARPIENYLFIKATEDTSYTIKLTFHSNKGYKLTKLILANDDAYRYKDLIECTDIEKVDKNYVVTYSVEKVTVDNQIYRTNDWYENETRHRFNTQGSNTYIRGVYFELPKTDETSYLTTI